MNKRIKVVGGLGISPRRDRDPDRVLNRGGVLLRTSGTYQQRQTIGNQRMEKKIIVVGAIGNTERQNRDDMRVLSGGGTAYTLKSHIDKDKPLVLKRYEKNKNNRSNG